MSILIVLYNAALVPYGKVRGIVHRDIAARNELLQINQGTCTSGVSGLVFGVDRPWVKRVCFLTRRIRMPYGLLWPGEGLWVPEFESGDSISGQRMWEICPDRHGFTFGKSGRANRIADLPNR